MIKKMKTRNVVIAILLLALVVTAFISTVFFLKKNNLEDVETVKNLVAKHYVLPGDEEPALATVTDKTKLNADFLRAAENGDKLLVYKNAKKVILYRPSVDRIVEVGPVSIAPADQSSEQ